MIGTRAPTPARSWLEHRHDVSTEPHDLETSRRHIRRTSYRTAILVRTCGRTHERARRRTTLRRRMNAVYWNRPSRTPAARSSVTSRQPIPACHDRCVTHLPCKPAGKSRLRQEYVGQRSASYRHRQRRAGQTGSGEHPPPRSRPACDDGNGLVGWEWDARVERARARRRRHAASSR